MPDENQLGRRTAALKGSLLGRRVKIRVPYEGGVFAEVGTVTGVAYPTIEVDCSTEKRYRHVDSIQIVE